METEGSPRELIKCKVELASLATDWDTTWRRARLRGLGSEATSFLWKLIHNILPTELRLARILPNQSPNCKFCPTPITADLPHCFFQCANTNTVGNWLLSLVSKHVPGATVSGLLKLDFEVEESKEMPLVWLLAQTFLYVWGVRASGNVVELHTTRSVLESKINLLR